MQMCDYEHSPDLSEVGGSCCVWLATVRSGKVCQNFFAEIVEKCLTSGGVCGMIDGKGKIY